MILRGPRRPDLLRDECLADLLAATAARRPDHPALIWRERTVTYGELAALAGAAARSLAARGAGPGGHVGLLLPRGADLLIAQAAIASSGAAWIPFDAEAPLERVAACLKAAGASGLLTCRAWLPRLAAGCPCPAWALEDLLAEDAATPGRPAPMPPHPQDCAYVIYTSGSTGEPKGVAVSQRSICHFLRSENEILGIRGDDRVYQGFSVAFDMSFEEIWMSYLAGATLWIAPPEILGDPDALAGALASQGITALHAVPTLMGLLGSVPPSVRLLNLGGEACPDALAARLARPGLRMFNTYGPTETTVSSSAAELLGGRPVSIGLPLPNYGMLVVDENRRPLPAGEVGELCVTGPGLAIGYLGRPELTAAKFADNPLAQSPAEARMYLTGDLARIEAGGPVHCLGRADNQVKIRGFRVELGEIETGLCNQPGIAACAVVLRNVDGMDALVGFAAAAGPQPPREAALRQALAAVLPAYMVPARIEMLADLPRLASGKIDRGALGRLPLSAVAAGGGHAPQDADEAALHAALRAFFPAADLRPEADFFTDLGGHSLLVARLVSVLRADPRYAKLGVSDVYRERRLGAIAQTMARLRGEKPAAPRRPHAGVPGRRHFLCGLAQALAVPPLILLHIGIWLAPFFTYHYHTGEEGDSIPLAVLYALGVFVLAHAGSFAIAILGKWLVMGRAKPGRYPLWGVVYFRHWLGGQLCHLPALRPLSGTPLLGAYLRLLGARVGRDVFIDSVGVQAPDLFSVGDGASVGAGVQIANARAEGGEWIVGKVALGPDSVTESYAVLEEDTALGRGARLEGLSSLASGRRIPDGETWTGSPARRTHKTPVPLPPRPRVPALARLAQPLFFTAAGMAVSVLMFTPVFPCFMLVDWIDEHAWDVYENVESPLTAFAAYFALAIPASLFLVLCMILLTAGVRACLMPRQKAGVWPLHGLFYCRKWAMSQILDGSLDALHGLYASVFAAGWLRLMGAKVGGNAEISTATGIMPDLLELGEESFIADGAMLGDEEIRDGWMALRHTRVGARSFVGNGAYLACGADVPADVLVGVQTRTPDNACLAPGQTWMGSPAILLPAREQTACTDPRLTFHPALARKLGRAAVEMLRIVLPMAFTIAAGYLIIQQVMPLAEDEEWADLALALLASGLLCGVVPFLFVAALKWLLIGRYKPRAAPMWTPFVWLSEGVTNVYESMAVPNFLGFLAGTPMLPWALRLLGARIGRRVWLATCDVTEFDCVEIGDESELNPGSGPQTHLFEDRVMKIGRVGIGRRVTVGPASTILYDSHVGDGVRLGPLSMVAKGERLPEGTRWSGSPACPGEG